MVFPLLINRFDQRGWPKVELEPEEDVFKSVFIEEEAEEDEDDDVFELLVVILES